MQEKCYFIILECVYPWEFSSKLRVFAFAIVSSHSFCYFVFSISRYLLEQDFPGMRIGPEPTTDSFIAVMYGDSEGNVPGNALVVDPKKPFRKLSRFGNAFLNR